MPNWIHEIAIGMTLLWFLLEIICYVRNTVNEADLWFYGTWEVHKGFQTIGIISLVMTIIGFLS